MAAVCSLNGGVPRASWSRCKKPAEEMGRDEKKKKKNRNTVSSPRSKSRANCWKAHSGGLSVRSSGLLTRSWTVRQDQPRCQPLQTASLSPSEVTHSILSLFKMGQGSVYFCQILSTRLPRMLLHQRHFFSAAFSPHSESLFLSLISSKSVDVYFLI